MIKLLINKFDFRLIVGTLLSFLLLLLLITPALPIKNNVVAHFNSVGQTCNGPFISVSQPLNDLGPNEYIRLNTGSTGHIGGLYPGGSNSRPPAHEAAGQAISQQITPLDAAGNPDPVNGKIVLVAIGMSNTGQEFTAFINQANADPAVNSNLVLVNGGLGGRTAERWADLNDDAWERLGGFLISAGVTPAQVQIAWVKLANMGSGNFPQMSLSLQEDLEQVARNILVQFPNTKIAYHSSRTRAYVYWSGLSPEPTAFETAFSVRWMIENQINGDPTLNFDPSNGAVVAPYLSWGSYLWIDGTNPRSDGRVWLPEDLESDCTHPSPSGEQKVGEQLLEFFKTDTTTTSWFLGDNPGPTPTPQPNPTAIPTPTSSPNPPLPYKQFIPLTIDQSH